MIEFFLKDLPFTMTRPMVREYEKKCSDLNYWLSRPKPGKVRLYADRLDTFQMVFALGIYYRYVIAPMASGANFFRHLDQNFQAGLKVGGRQVNKEDQKKILNGAARFEAMVSEFGLSRRLLAETEVNRIVTDLIEIDERSLRNP